MKRCKDWKLKGKRSRLDTMRFYSLLEGLLFVLCSQMLSHLKSLKDQLNDFTPEMTKLKDFWNPKLHSDVLQKRFLKSTLCIYGNDY